MGKMQRNKGARVERELVAQLKAEGWQAMRVPLSGATDYAKGDVDVWDETGFRFNIEVKSRKDGFKTLYDAFEGIANTIFYNDTKIAASYNISYLFTGFSPGVGFTKTPKYFNTLKKLKGGSLVLAVKANNKPFIFIRWFDENI